MLLIPWYNFIQPRVFARWLINSPLTVPSDEIKGIYNRHVNPRHSPRSFSARPMKFLVRHFSAPPGILCASGTKPGGELSSRRNNGNHRPRPGFCVQANESTGSLSQECKKRSFRSFIHSRRAGIRRDSLPEQAATRPCFFLLHFINSLCITRIVRILL